MAVGDDAKADGYPLVPPNGEEGRVRYGYREINRTRDFIALVARRIPSSKAAFRTAAGITYGTAEPTGGDTGDIYFRLIT